MSKLLPTIVQCGLDLIAGSWNAFLRAQCRAGEITIRRGDEPPLWCRSMKIMKAVVW